MEFSDEGIILSARAHGETHAVAELFTAAHGRWAGLVYGGQGRRQRPLLQPGNAVTASWKGRLADSLGHFTLEMRHAYAGDYMHDQLSLGALTATCATAAACLPEREGHAGSYRAMSVLIEHMDELTIWPALMARWELGLLAELGFGLTLDRCAATGDRDNLVFVSPRSACAVSADAGAPYKDKLLPLPAFLRGPGEASLDDAVAALTTTGYFIETRILHVAGKELPAARADLLDRLRKKAADLRGPGDQR